jgi:hypothetical protein
MDARRFWYPVRKPVTGPAIFDPHKFQSVLSYPVNLRCISLLNSCACSGASNCVFHCGFVTKSSWSSVWLPREIYLVQSARYETPLLLCRFKSPKIKYSLRERERETFHMRSSRYSKRPSSIPMKQCVKLQMCAL